MELWRNSSALVKAAIVGAAALAVLLLIFLINTLTGPPADEGAVEVLTPAATATAADAPPATQPPTAESGQSTAAASVTVNVRQGPGLDYPIIGMLMAGQTAPVVGRSADGNWWAIEFPVEPAGQGWVTAQYVTTTDADAVPIVDAPAVPTPTQAPPVAITAWRGEYFANRELQGAPVTVRNDERIDFNWGDQPPADGMPATNWSARWTISRNLAAGTYRFSVWVDDGMRLFVDDQLVIDGWQAGTARNYTVDLNLAAGAHSARVEYFQGDGGALMQLAIGYVEGYPDWKAEYFGNPDLAETPLVVRNESAIDFDWGANPPADGLPADNWSARWTRSYDLAAGAYVINADVQGGMRLWLDDRLLIDSWTEGDARTLTAETGFLEAGRANLRVEYVNRAGDGRLILTSSESDGDPIPPKAIIQGPTRVEVGAEAAFTAVGSQVAAGSYVAAINWDLGDGATDSGVTVSHTYGEPGLYTIVLTVTDDKGLSDTATQQIRVVDEESTPEAPAPPVAVIDAPAQVDAGTPATFYAGNSQSINPIVRYSWNFGDGTVGDGLSVSKTYTEPGVYSVNLTVIDDHGLSSDAARQITVVEPAATEEPDVTPEPSASPDATAEPTEAPTEEPTEEPTGEPTDEATAAPGESPEPTAPPDATPAPTDDADGGAPPLPESPVVVTVDGQEVAPTEIDGVPTLQIGVGQSMRIDASQATAANPDLVFTWDMGDGSAPLTGTVVEHSYATPGSYTVQADVDNGVETVSTVWQIIVAGE